MNRRLHGSSSGAELNDARHGDALPRLSTPLQGGLGDEKEDFPDFTTANGHPSPASQEKLVVDAGLKSLDHYKRAMPAWRYKLREVLLPMVRWETPYLAYFQNAARTPALDRYFAITANLGTHTFFMIGLPILFWCGNPAFGKGLVHILAEGVFFSGFLKDMLSLPRPLSPPLHRITMSGSVALEYGFPSTHSANAVSVAVYALLLLRSPDCTFTPSTRIALEALGYFYAASIIIGRLYCGMHGFADVIVGGILGALISLLEFYYAPSFETSLHASGWAAPLTVALIVIILVRIHPEPVDDCPCFDDSVAFSGVIIGVEVASWRTGATQYVGPFPGLSWPVMVARIVLGVLIIVAWREAMKPTLLKLLPFLFRLISRRTGVTLPRRFFTPASEYEKIPDLLRLRFDNLFPTVSDLPHFVKTLRAPARGRSISIGPQSAADAYEALAYRERRRRESIGSNGSLRSVGGGGGGGLDLRERFQADGAAIGNESASPTAAVGKSTGLAEFEHQMGQGRIPVVRLRTARSLSPVTPAVPEEGEEEQEAGDYMGVGPMDGAGDDADELGEREMFEQLVKPRVRYDVEVVTKLVVYTGIAWLAVEGIPGLHELIGLGVRHLQVV